MILIQGLRDSPMVWHNDNSSQFDGKNSIPATRPRKRKCIFSYFINWFHEKMGAKIWFFKIKIESNRRGAAVTPKKLKLPEISPDLWEKSKILTCIWSNDSRIGYEEWCDYYCTDKRQYRRLGWNLTSPFCKVLEQNQTALFLQKTWKWKLE